MWLPYLCGTPFSSDPAEVNASIGSANSDKLFLLLPSTMKRLSLLSFVPLCHTKTKPMSLHSDVQTCDGYTRSLEQWLTSYHRRPPDSRKSGLEAYYNFKPT